MDMVGEALKGPPCSPPNEINGSYQEEEGEEEEEEQTSPLSLSSVSYASSFPTKKEDRIKLYPIKNDDDRSLRYSGTGQINDYQTEMERVPEEEDNSFNNHLLSTSASNNEFEKRDWTQRENADKTVAHSAERQQRGRGRGLFNKGHSLRRLLKGKKCLVLTVGTTLYILFTIKESNVFYGTSFQSVTKEWTRTYEDNFHQSPFNKSTRVFKNTTWEELQLSRFSDSFIMNLDLHENSYWGENIKHGRQLICDNIEKMSKIRTYNEMNSPVLNFTIECQDYYKKGEFFGLGSGNYISAMYGLRLAALTYGNVDVFMSCNDAEEKKTELLLPWVMGYWPARNDDSETFPWPHPDSLKGPIGLPSIEDACGNYDKCPIGHMTAFMRYEFRRLAITIGGTPSSNHPSFEYAKKYLWKNSPNSGDIYQVKHSKEGDDPLVPGMQFDDVAIHFRCGDIMGATTHPSFGFMKFVGYKKRIFPEATSIGIITNPFDSNGQLRKGPDSRLSVLERCEIVVLALQDYLSKAYPNAEVRIWNDLNETLPMAYTRLIMANQTFSTISSFGVFPVVASFGTGYARKPDFDKVPNKWLPLVSEMYDDVKMMNEPERLMAADIRNWLNDPENSGMERILWWFMEDEYRKDDPFQKNLTT